MSIGKRKCLVLQSELCMRFSNKSSRVNHKSLFSYRIEQGRVKVPFHDYLSNDWLNMNIAGANNNQNQDHNNLFGNVNELRGTVDRTVEDFGGFRLNGMQDLELHMGVDLNQNPAQETRPSHEATSV